MTLKRLHQADRGLIPVYVINLERSIERRAWMEKELAGARVNAEFVSAIDGRRFSATCMADLARRNPARPISAAEAACAVSHRKTWRKILCSGAPFAVVLEDDVHLGRGLAEVLESDWARWRFDVVKLETRLEEGWLSRSGDAVRGNPERSVRRLYSGNLGTAAYLLSAGGARKLLAVTREFVDPLDVVLFSDQAVRSGALTIFQLRPAVAVQEELLARKTMTDSALGGTIGDDRGDIRVKRSLSASAKIMREFRRPLSRLASAVEKTICRLRNRDREWRVIEFE